ncbi:hypothetical protein [Streptodolium elevatio]|uniref:Uncharacterized protein n=1 Tax=Streptodolium elevatio TaxID=3157996 RepID=A0ABV3DVJ7_9ACTN
MREVAGRVAGVVALLLIGAIVYALYAPSGGSTSGSGGPSRQPVAPSLGGLPTDPADERAVRMTAEQAAPYLARDVAVRSDASGVMVTWRPARVDGVVGHLVAVVAADGRIIERGMVEPSRSTTVFGPRPDGAAVCATVTTVVGGGGTLWLAPGERVCPEPGAAAAPTG